MFVVKLSNEPSVLPANLFVTDSQIFSATSAATFLAIRCSRIVSIPTCKSSAVNVFEAKTLTFFNFVQKFSAKAEARLGALANGENSERKVEQTRNSLDDHRFQIALFRSSGQRSCRSTNFGRLKRKETNGRFAVRENRYR